MSQIQSAVRLWWHFLAALICSDERAARWAIMVCILARINAVRYANAWPKANNANKKRRYQFLDFANVTNRCYCSTQYLHFYSRHTRASKAQPQQGEYVSLTHTPNVSSHCVCMTGKQSSMDLVQLVEYFAREWFALKTLGYWIKNAF